VLGDESLLGGGVLLHRVYYYEHTLADLAQ
jgi:hypothetical protein